MNIKQVSIVFAPLVLSNIVHFFTMQNTQYASDLPLQPPSYVFGIAWTLIYLLYGVFLYRIFHKKDKRKWTLLMLWSLNFLINLAWSPIVFQLGKYTFGVYMIVFLLGTLLAMLVTTSDVMAKQCLVPYMTWLILALLLNVELAKRHSHLK